MPGLAINLHTLVWPHPNLPCATCYKGSKCNDQSDVLFFTSKFEDTVKLTFQQKVCMKLDHLRHQKYQVDSFSSLSNLRSANCLGLIAPISVMRLSCSFMMSLLAMPFRDRFCFSRKGRIGGRGWMYPKGANIMAASGLSSS